MTVRHALKIDRKNRNVRRYHCAYSVHMPPDPTKLLSGISHQAGSRTDQDSRWAVVVNRDPCADGEFYYAVITTGVYCRPSCPARTPKPENVCFYATRVEAEQAGFRPCKRCKPDQPSLHEQHVATVVSICRVMECAETMPKLEELARRANMSPGYFHRLFKAVTGLTPKAYMSAQLGKRVRSELRHSATVTDAIYDTGYNSNSRFYEHSKRILGMTPSSYRAGGMGADIFFAVGECSLGSILVASSERGVCAILLGDDPDELLQQLQDQFPAANLIGGDGGYEGLIAQVVGFVEAPGLGHALPLDIQGTAFQERVWQALREIPAGETVSYSRLAGRIGMPRSARAVARACAANRLAVAIPCHRVVRNDGSISGYRWGVERKQALLQREAGAETRQKSSPDENE